MLTNTIKARPVLGRALALAGGLTAMASLDLAAQQAASAPVLYACYVPASGTVYRIKVAGGKDSCTAPSHVEFSWNASGPAGPQGDTGPMGPVGPAGATGPAGASGPAGPQGVKGDAGPAGADGPKGDTGPAGATGPQGPKGDAGPAGATGAAGPKGDAGPAGATGAAGPKGDAGPAGATGPAGPQGDTGAAGAQGPKGDTGATGPAGPQGDTGATGPAGATGTQGPKGDTGATGPAGPEGPKGDTGPAGATGAAGAAGPAGPQGETGPAGPQGETGPAGPQGEAGAKGETGAAGPQGEKGETGATGAAGAAGVVATNSAGSYNLQNNNGWVAAGSFGTGNIPAEGSGTRAMWHAARAAFRAGYVNGTQWDDANIGQYSVAFGQNVRASGDNSVAFGTNTTAANLNSFAVGENNVASGASSVALGSSAHTNTKQGSFVFSDRSLPSDTLRAGFAHQASWRVSGGFRIFTSSTTGGSATGIHLLPNSATYTQSWQTCGTHAGGTIFLSTSTCATLTSGGAWTNSSDVNRKHLFERVDGEDVLARLRTLQISSWSYRAEDATVRHLGPTAQDFRSAFGLGANETSITTVDADGVALASVKALDARTTAQRGEIDALRAQVEALLARNAEMAARLERLEAAQRR